MLNQYRLENILFIDIETVPAYSDYKAMPEIPQNLWNKKATHLGKKGETPEELYPRAGIYAEFGKIVCIGTGYFKKMSTQPQAGEIPLKREFVTKMFYGDDENALLNNFAAMADKEWNSQQHLLCAHNGKEFDFPYIARRMIINGIRLPSLLNIAGKKPWEVGHLDTMELWKFGDYKHFTSIELLSTLLNIPSPKEGIDGSMVGSVYWQEKDLEKIAIYCRKDVVAVAQIILRFKGLPILDKTEICV